MSSLVQAVDYRPRVSVEVGVGNFVRWYQDYYRA
jgi:UDP-glucuronate 4-epimerase